MTTKLNKMSLNLLDVIQDPHFEYTTVPRKIKENISNIVQEKIGDTLSVNINSTIKSVSNKLSSKVKRWKKGKEEFIVTHEDWLRERILVLENELEQVTFVNFFCCLHFYNI